MKNLTFLLEALPAPPRHWLLYLWNFYPPFLGAGIWITGIAPDLSWVEARLRLRWWNRNYVGTMFGGSIFSMCDPFYLVMLQELLGPRYIVRDKGADIKFLKKGLGTARVRFEVGTNTVAEIWNEAADVQERRFTAHVRNAHGELIAEVTKTLHIRRRSETTE